MLLRETLCTAGPFLFGYRKAASCSWGWSIIRGNWSRKIQDGDKPHDPQRRLGSGLPLCLSYELLLQPLWGPGELLALGLSHLSFFPAKLEFFLATLRELTGTWVHFSTFLSQMKCMHNTQCEINACNTEKGSITLLRECKSVVATM